MVILHHIGHVCLNKIILFLDQLNPHDEYNLHCKSSYEKKNYNSQNNQSWFHFHS